MPHLLPNNMNILTAVKRSSNFVAGLSATIVLNLTDEVLLALLDDGRIDAEEIDDIATEIARIVVEYVAVTKGKNT